MHTTHKTEIVYYYHYNNNIIELWIEHMNFATDNNATCQQLRLGEQRGACSRGALGEVPVVAARRTDRQIDTHSDTQTLSITIPSPLT